MSKPTIISFPVESFRHLETPYSKSGLRDYFAIVAVKDLPDLDGWRQINVRDPKLRGAVPTAIRQGYRDEPETFLFMNRGIVIAASKVEYDNKDSTVRLHLSEPRLHGLLDGGHSYNIVREEYSEDEDPTRYIKLEILEGFDHEGITNVVDARNTSNQVKDESLLNLKGDFGDLQNALKGKSYYPLIAWKEYETDDDGTPKPIDVREIIAILTAFDRSHFDEATHPINSYRSKAACLKHFKDNKDAYKKLYPIADDLLRLHDYVQLKLPRLYNKVRGITGEVGGGRFGRLTGVTVYKGKRRAPLYFLETETEYGVPSGFVYPILGSFRSMLVENRNGHYEWAKKVDPFALFDGDLGERLARVIGDFALEAQNPSKTGKSPNVWQSCYVNAENTFLRLS